MRAIALLLVLLIARSLTADAAAQNALDEAKAQYEAAAYEQALDTLTQVPHGDGQASRVEVEQYRALCLIALGHMTDAERAVAALVAADPVYVPSPSVASPRVLALVAEIRQKELPNAARRLLDTGRLAYKSNDLVSARQQFELLLKLLDEPAMATRAETDDLRAIALGFATLIEAAPTASTPLAASPETNGGLTAAPAPGETSLPAAAAAAAAVPAAPPEAVTTPEVFVPAIALQQSLPPWEPPSATIAQSEYSGLLRLRIGADGSVTAATIEHVSHPAYDGRLLQVAPTWRFKPATRNGVPVESEKTMAIQLRPQQ